MRRGILGSIVALLAGAGGAFGQGPAPIGAAGSRPPVMAGDVIPAQAPTLMPPLSVGPPNDPLGLGPTDSIGPPPSPMYPMPGPYGAPQFQPPPQNTDDYGPLPRYEVWGNYGLWLNKAQPVPGPLLTTSAPSQGGVLGQGSTLVLAGARPINYGVVNGMDFGFDFWGDQDRRFGFLMDGFYTQNATVSTKISATGSGSGGAGSLDIPLLARPFYDTTYGPTALVVSGPNIGAASAVVSTSSQVWGVSPTAMINLWRSAPGESWQISTDFLVGYKFMDLRETLAVSTDTYVNAVTSTPVYTISPTTGFPVVSGFSQTPIPVTVGGVTITAPGQIAIEDRFTCNNIFNGTTIGLRNEVRYGMFSLQTTGQIGLGVNQQILEIQGYTYVQNTTTATRNGGLGTAYGGLYANANNIGKYSQNEFACIPSVTANLGINLTRSMTFYVGYNFMWMNNVIRPGDQMPTVINSASVPLSPNYGSSTTAPAYQRYFNVSDYWLMGANFGLEFKW